VYYGLGILELESEDGNGVPCEALCKRYRLLSLFILGQLAE
jgi:hypothetical protein